MSKHSRVEGVQAPVQAHGPLCIPEQSPSTRSLISGTPEKEETTMSSKELGEWLSQHPTYTMDMAGFTPVSLPLFYSFILIPQSFTSCHSL